MVVEGTAEYREEDDEIGDLLLGYASTTVDATEKCFTRQPANIQPERVARNFR
jgi:hypothetical protein